MRKPSGISSFHDRGFSRSLGQKNGRPLAKSRVKDPRIELVHRFFAGTGTTYDQVVDLCTLGLDRLWKRNILRKIPPRPARIADLACGTGILTLRIARRFPGCRVVGVELREEYLAIAREKAKGAGVANVEFILGRAEEAVLGGEFDCITASYLAKYADLPALVKNVEKRLRRGGLLVMHEFTLPPRGPFTWLWEQHFKTLQCLGTWRYPAWKTSFYELPELIRKTKWVDEMVRLLRAHGFSHITIEPLTLETSTIVTATR